MKDRTIVLVIIVFILAGASLALPQQDEKPHSSIGPIVPCSSDHLYVSARSLLASRTRFAMPEYPPVAVEAKIQGDVVLLVLVNKQGNVIGAQVKSGNPVLSVAAIKAVEKWKYEPIALKQGQIDAEGLVALTFHLDGPSVTDAGPPESVDLIETTLHPKPICHAALNVFEGKLIHRVDPDFPETAKAAHVEGDVVIDIVIDKAGSIAQATVVRGHPLLADAALKAVKQWKYTPYVQDGKPIEILSRVTVRFHM